MGQRTPRANVEVGRRVSAAITNSELSQRVISERLGVGESAVSKWKSGQPPGTYMLPKIAHVLGVPVESFWDSGKERTSSGALGGKNLRPVPLVGATAAGEPMSRIYESTDLQVFDLPPAFLRYMYRTEPDLERAILMKVQGDSMGEEMPDGSYALVDRGPGGEGWPAEKITPEDIYMVRPPGEDGVTLKHVSIEAGWIHLIPSATSRGHKVRSFPIAKGTKIQTIIRGKVVCKMERL